MRPTTPNILATLALATDAEMIEGSDWYPAAHRLAVSLDGEDGRMGAGVIAALSPITPWKQNVVLAERAFENDGLTGGTLGNSVRAANRILAGEDPLDVLNGRKVRNFFMAIADPEHATAIVIDRHAHDVAVGKVCTDADRRVLAREAGYATHARAYARAAVIAGTSPSTVQAITWTTWRRLKGLK